MKTRTLLNNTIDEIQKKCPQLPIAYQGESNQTKEKRAIISDLQQRFAEIYMVLKDLATDIPPELTFDQAFKQQAKIMQQGLNQILVLSLAISTKLKHPTIAECLSNDDITRVESINRLCFEITTKGSPDWRAYQAGIVKPHEYTHYKTGISKRVSPGMLPGQIMMGTIAGVEHMASFTAALVECRQTLDPQYKPTADQIQMIGGDPKLLSQFKQVVQEKLNFTYPAQKTNDAAQALRRCTALQDAKTLEALLTDKNILAAINKQDNGANGFTALHIACSDNKTPQASLLLQAGATSHIKDKQSGMTALHRAVIGKHVDCAKLLIAAGADPDSLDNHGKSPRDYAANDETLLAIMLDQTSKIRPN